MKKRMLALALAMLIVLQALPAVTLADAGGNSITSETIASEDYYTVRFVVDEGDAPSARYYLADGGHTLGELPEAPQADGKVFLGWYLADGDSPVDASTLVASDMTLVARYQGQHALYGALTAEGTGNASGNVVWKEYEHSGETTLIFSVVNASAPSEDRAITTSFRNNAALSGSVTRIVLEEGISGIGWTHLYSRTDGEPRWPASYRVDTSKTDIFRGFRALREVVLCGKLERVGWSAFNGCTKLSKVDFTASPALVEIMNQAFYNCAALNAVDLSNCGELTTIGWSAFNGAGRGKDAQLALPAQGKLNIIGGYAFKGDTNDVIQSGETFTLKNEETIMLRLPYGENITITEEEVTGYTTKMRLAAAETQVSAMGDADKKTTTGAFQLSTDTAYLTVNNDLPSISPTGNTIHYAPYILMLLGGAMILLLASKRKKRA